MSCDVQSTFVHEAAAAPGRRFRNDLQQLFLGAQDAKCKVTLYTLRPQRRPYADS